MHQEALTGSFHDSAWRLERSMRGGPFNCVTSTVLYLSLCQRFDIEATAVAQKHHVYCRLTDGATVDVQTTCAEWFAADGKPRGGEFHDMPAGQPRLISETQLLGKIYYNRAVSLSIAKHCRPAIDYFRRAVHLDPQDLAAEQNLLAAMNNWALQLSDAGRYAPAARFIVEGLELSPAHRELLANDLHVHQQWALELCQAGSFAEAVRILESCHRRRADVELFDQGRWSVYHRWAESLLERQQVDEMHAVFAQAQARYGDVPELQACFQAVRAQHDQREFHTACP
jgi:tetratricopeptide (TPR) repeat protein